MKAAVRMLMVVGVLGVICWAWLPETFSVYSSPSSPRIRSSAIVGPYENVATTDDDDKLIDDILVEKGISDPLLKVFRRNSMAVNELRSVLGRKDETVTKITAYGGSITAGGGSVKLSKRFYSVFRDLLSKRLWKSTSLFSVHNGGHGSRNSLYGTTMYGTQVPKGTDILLWEFSVNDENLRTEGDSLAVPYVFEMFMKRVMRERRPPVVILVYIYRGRIFRMEKEDKFIQDCFDVTKGLAEKYPFVLGYINLAESLNSMPKSYEKTLGQFVANDGTHPTNRGHKLIAKHIMQLIDIALQIPIEEGDVTGEIFPKPAQLEWPCAPHGFEIANLLERTDTTHISWNAELPNAGLTEVELEFGQSMSRDLLYYGTAHKNREDRQLAVDLPCCSSSVGSAARLKVGRAAYGFALFVDEPDEIEIMIDKKASMKRINAMDWGTKCFLETFPGFNLWFIIDEPPFFLEEVRLCKKSCRHKNGLHWATFSVLDL